ncbi:hypothetical protein T484DRAFT_1767746, partial [Baffinella frigidus]
VIAVPQAQAIAPFTAPDRHGAPAEFLLVGAFPNASGANPPATLLKGRREVIEGMRGPVSVAVSPVDGRHVYVASKYSKSISVFDRDPSSGMLRVNPSASYWSAWTASPISDSNPPGDGYRTPEAWGSPLDGIQSIVVAPDQAYLYAASAMEGAIAVFATDAVTGALTLQQVVRNAMANVLDGKTVFGLSGAYGLSLSPDGARLLVSSWHDQAVALFERGGDGVLVFHDAVTQGERIVTSFNDVVSDAAAYPMRLGGEDDAWYTSARDSKFFILTGTSYMVVATAGSDAGAVGGAASVFVWRDASDKFELLQRLEENVGASSVEAFTVVDESTYAPTTLHFIAVGNSYNTNSSAGVNLYTLSAATGRFTLHSALQTPSGTPILANALRYFSFNDVQYLAVARGWHTLTAPVASAVYRWNDGLGFGTAPMQEFPTEGAMGVEFMAMPTAGAEPLGLLMFSDFMSWSAGDMAGAGVGVYAVDPDTELFVPQQNLTIPGAFHAAPFSVPNEGYFVAVAVRQTQPPFSNGDYSAYDQASYIYKWDAGGEALVLYQTLGAGFKSVVEDGVPVAVQDGFCAPACTPVGTGGARPTDLLRGTTSFAPFEFQGETYLVAAQSVCEPWWSSTECAAFGAQPKSAILQFDRTSRMFGELRVLTHSDSEAGRGRPLSDTEDTHPDLTAALRINAGRAVKFQHLQFAGNTFLLVCSLTRGLVLYPWHFETVTGLKGVVAAAFGSDGTHAYAASRIDKALVPFRVARGDDRVGGAVRSCATGACLSYMARNVDGAAHGLAAAHTIRVSNGAIGVNGILPRHQLLCGPYPPVSANAPPGSSAPPNAARCCTVELVTEQVALSNEHLFTSPPAVLANGSLTFALAPRETGTASFSVAMRVDGARSGEARRFDVAVLRINDAPSFRVVSELHIYSGPGDRT